MRVRRNESATCGIGAIEAAVFALLRLPLGFSFAGGTSRLDAKRQLIVAEANDIGTAYLRLDELPVDSADEALIELRDSMHQAAEKTSAAVLPTLRASKRVPSSYCQRRCNSQWHVRLKPAAPAQARNPDRSPDPAFPD